MFSGSGTLNLARLLLACGEFHVVAAVHRRQRHYLAEAGVRKAEDANLAHGRVALSAASTSEQSMFSPPRIIRSFMRSRM